MKHILMLVAGLCFCVGVAFAGDAGFKFTPGFYAGIGGSWTSIDEQFNSLLITTLNRSGRDHYRANQNHLAPLLQIGYARPFCGEWLWGLLAQWQYINYHTPNLNTTRGQYLPNASFSSINIFGPQVIRDFSSESRVSHAGRLLVYVGAQVTQGYVYVGVGPEYLQTSNSIYVSSVHIPNGVGDHLISTSVGHKENIWAWAAQVGYDYYLSPCYFLNISYTYAQSRKYHFNNTINTDILNGRNLPGTTALHLRRSIRYHAQDVLISINRAF